MIYCYLRVSTDSQDVDSQRLGIQDFCRARGWTDMEWISDEGVSGAKDPSKRLLGKLLKKARSGDCVIASEISRIGRKLDMILNVIKDCTERGIKLYTVKDRYVLEDTIQSKGESISDATLRRFGQTGVDVVLSNLGKEKTI